MLTFAGVTKLMLRWGWGGVGWGGVGWGGVGWGGVGWGGVGLRGTVTGGRSKSSLVPRFQERSKVCLDQKCTEEFPNSCTSGCTDLGMALTLLLVYTNT